VARPSYLQGMFFFIIVALYPFKDLPEPADFSRLYLTVLSPEPGFTLFALKVIIINQDCLNKYAF